MLDAMPPVPAAHTVTDLRVGMTVRVAEGADVYRLTDHLVRCRTSNNGYVDGRVDVVRVVGSQLAVMLDTGEGLAEIVMLPVVCQVIAVPRGATVQASELRPDDRIVYEDTPDLARFRAMACDGARGSKRIPRAEEVEPRRGMTVRVETQWDVKALIGRRVRMEGSLVQYEVTGGTSRSYDGVMAMEVKDSSPLRIPRSIIVCDDAPARTCENHVDCGAADRSARGQGLEGARHAERGGKVTHSRCSDCRDTGILPGFGFGTSIDACDRSCSCEVGKRKSEGDGPSEWTVVKREVQREPAMEDGSYSAEHVTVQRGRQVVRFRVVAHHDEDENYFATVVVREASEHQQRFGRAWDVDALRIRGEACIDMARYEQRCEQIAREPELWECEGGERVEVRP